MQSSLPQDLVPLGSSTLLCVISTSCAVFMAVGQTVFNQRLKANLSNSLSQGVVEEIIDSGVTSLRSLVSASDLPVVINEYSESVTQVWVSTEILEHQLSGLFKESTMLTCCHQVHSGRCTSHFIRAAAWLQMDLDEE